YSGSPYCSSASPAAVSLTGTSGGAFTSSPAGLTLNSSTGQITPSSSTAGVYTVTYTVAASGGCSSAVATTSVTINQPDNAGFSYSANTFCTSQSDPSAIISGVTGGTFSSSPAGLVLNSGTGLIDLSESTTGTYSITYATAGVCGNSSSVSLSIVAPPTISILGSDNLSCTAASVTRTASGANSYSWSNGLGNNAQVSITTPGIYTVTGTSTDGCSATATTEVLDNTVEIIASASNSGPYFEGSLIQLMASGGSSYSWVGPDGFTSTLQNPSIADAKTANAGIYTLTVYSNGCSATATTEVNVSCQQVAMDYYLAYAEPELEVIAPISDNLQVQQSDRKMTVIALTTCEFPVIESVKLQLSGTSNVRYYEDNNMPFTLHEVNQQLSGDVLEPNLYTFIARGYDQDNAQGNVLVGPDIYQFYVVTGTRTVAEPTVSSTNICVGSSLTVSTSVTGTFGEGNSYQVYLSDANGDFGNAILIGTATSPTGINCSLPNFLKSSDQYRIKVTSTAPVVSSVISSYTLSIVSSDVLLSSPNDDLNNANKDHKAINTMQASNKIQGNASSRFTTGKSIVLKPGFQSGAGTVFEAKIQNVCP
ncbi:MAG: hypothetical protein NXI00_21800, partial [Cytophagales bacterium]|nr:hypothetical protein [Cytophagales bacterium]